MPGETGESFAQFFVVGGNGESGDSGGAVEGEMGGMAVMMDPSVDD